MSITMTTYDVGTLLGALRLQYKITNIIKHITTQYIIKDFGVIVSVIITGDKSRVMTKLEDTYPGYKYIFITVGDNVDDHRYPVIWELMRSGYMMWLRTTYGSSFKLILESGNLANLIIDERLRIWDDQPMYKFLIDINLLAKKVGAIRSLSTNPAFFDYMP